MPRGVPKMSRFFYYMPKCTQCGRRFRAARKHAVTCSDKCRQAKHRSTGRPKERYHEKAAAIAAAKGKRGKEGKSRRNAS